MTFEILKWHHSTCHFCILPFYSTVWHPPLVYPAINAHVCAELDMERHERGFDHAKHTTVWIRTWASSVVVLLACSTSHCPASLAVSLLGYGKVQLFHAWHFPNTRCSNCRELQVSTWRATTAWSMSTQPQADSASFSSLSFLCSPTHLMMTSLQVWYRSWHHPCYCRIVFRPASA